jgi:hypothetical protein
MTTLCQCGGELRARLADGSLVNNLTSVLKLQLDLCSGMKHVMAHALTVHRDIKPAIRTRSTAKFSTPTARSRLPSTAERICF